MINKDKVLEACYAYLAKRVEQIQLAIDDANYSIREETKSSAGDKYETSREMIQQDLTRYQQQLMLAQQDQDILKKIEEQNIVHQAVGLGSLVKTNKGTYFVSISIGELKIEESSVFVISLQSPIGQGLKGKKVGDLFTFRANQEQEILHID